MPNAPSNINPSFKKVRDPFTNLQTGTEFTARLDFDAAQLKISAAVDLDGEENFNPCTFDVLSFFPPLIKINGITVPQDGLSHPVRLRFWHDDGGVLSDVVEPGKLVAMFDMAPPPVPTGVTVTVLRDRTGALPDQVRVQWTSANDVQVLCLDDEGKKRTVATMSEVENQVILEGMSRFGVQDGAQRQYRFGVRSYNRSNSSEEVYAAPVNLTTGTSAVQEPSPDDIAGTAEYLNDTQFMSWMQGQFPGMQSADLQSVWYTALDKIKDVVAKGGSVMLPDVGIFEARWRAERTVFRNGTYTVIPAVRNAGFSFSRGFSKGTELGQVMTDTEAALYR